MRLIRLVVAALALSLALGAGFGSVATAKKRPVVKRAKQLCKKKRGKAKRNCVRKQVKRLKRIQRRQRQRELKRPPVTIRTTEFGIPRIVADNWRGLGYGYGYSLASQNICSMAQIYTTVRGERSRYFGPDATWMLSGNGIPYTNLQMDFAHRQVIAAGTIPRVLKMKPPNGPRPELKTLIDGYVKGYNSYLKRTGVGNLPDATCKGKPWVKPITKQDAYLRFFELGTMAGLGLAVDGIADAAPPVAGAAADPGAGGQTITPEQIEMMKAHEPKAASNGVALGSDATSTGKGMLFGNPHFPWFGSERFVQSQMTIPGKVNVSGASMLGVPLIIFGHTKKLAWTHTASFTRRFVLFQEKLVPGKPTWYYLNGKQTPMKKTRVTVQARQSDGKIKPETRTLYSTVHGPITTTFMTNPAFSWGIQNAYSIFDANANGMRFINHFFDAAQAQSVDRLVKILKRDLGVPLLNTLATDTTGKALYADIGSIPNVDDDKVAECNVGIGKILWPSMRVPVLDGSLDACDLKRAPGTPVKGLLPINRMPLQIRDDYTSNMNDGPWLSNPKAPLEGFPGIMGEEKSARSLRTRNGLNQIEERLAGTDGNPGNLYTPELLRGFIDNNRHYGGELLMPDLIAWCAAQPSPVTVNAVDVTQACSVLAGWDMTDNLDSPGAYLARLVIDGILEADGGIYTTPFSLADPVHTPRGLDTANPEVLKALADAVTGMNGLGVPLDATWRDHQYVTRAGEKIPIPGGPAWQGVFNVIEAPRNPVTGDYDDVVYGSSFTMMASMNGAACPDVKTVLDYSQVATNEASPHFKDQTKLLPQKRWVTDRFCVSQQKASPGLRVRNLNGGARAVRKGW